jgi:hypothetical protein
MPYQTPLTAADLGILENFCIAVGQVHDMERLVGKEGHVAITVTVLD